MTHKKVFIFILLEYTSRDSKLDRSFFTRIALFTSSRSFFVTSKEKDGTYRPVVW